MNFLEFIRVRQMFETRSIPDPHAFVRDKIRALDLSDKIIAGQSVTVGCSSRDISNYDKVVKATVDGLKAHGLEPFLFPSMGSHGAATAEGQKRGLEL